MPSRFQEIRFTEGFQRIVKEETENSLFLHCGITCAHLHSLYGGVRPSPGISISVGKAKQRKYTMNYCISR